MSKYNRGALFMALVSLGLGAVCWLLEGLDWYQYFYGGQFVRDFLIGFLSNLAAIVVGLIIVDRLVRGREKDEWSQFHRLTYSDLALCMARLLGNVFICFPPRLDLKQEANRKLMFAVLNLHIDEKQPAILATILGHRAPQTETAHAVQHLPRLVAHVCEDVNDDLAERLTRWLDLSNRPLDMVRFTIIPRLIETAGSVHLLQKLAEFDSASLDLARSGDLMRHVPIEHRHPIIERTAQRLVSLLENAVSLYDYLSQEWKRFEKKP